MFRKNSAAGARVVFTDEECKGLSSRFKKKSGLENKRREGSKAIEKAKTDARAE